MKIINALTVVGEVDRPRVSDLIKHQLLTRYHGPYVDDRARSPLENDRTAREYLERKLQSL
jgi:hypothetical protein